MGRRVIASVALSAAIALIASLPVSGQTGGVPPMVVTAYNGGPAIPYTTPRTPWGDPDLQGVWSSDDATMPMSRGAGRGAGAGPAAAGGAAAPAGTAPAAAGAAAAPAGAAPAVAGTAPTPAQQPATGLYLNDEQWAARQKQVQGGIQNALNAVGSFRGDFARRAFRQTSLIVDPPDGRTPAFTAEAQKRRAPRDQGTFGNGPFDTTEDFTLYDRCITRGIVGSVMRVVYGNGNRIVQAPGMVAISYEMIHDTRVFYTDGRPHIGQRIRQYLGDSRARWEGDVLVVETTNLTDKTSIGPNGNGLRHSDQMKITEQFKRVANDIVQYQLTIDDPVTYARPFTLSLPLTPLDGGVLLPYECHEGNYAIRQSLGAERAEDVALAADLAKGIKRERRPVQDGLGVGGQPIGEGRGRGAGPGGGRGAAPGGPPPIVDPERPPQQER